MASAAPLLIYPENGDSIFLRNFRTYTSNHTTPHPRRRSVFGIPVTFNYIHSVHVGSLQRKPIILRFHAGCRIVVSTPQIHLAVRLVLLTGGCYKVWRWDGLVLCIFHTQYHENWSVHSFERGAPDLPSIVITCSIPELLCWKWINVLSSLLVHILKPRLSINNDYILKIPRNFDPFYRTTFATHPSIRFWMWGQTPDRRSNKGKRKVTKICGLGRIHPSMVYFRLFPKCTAVVALFAVKVPLGNTGLH